MSVNGSLKSAITTLASKHCKNKVVALAKYFVTTVARLSFHTNSLLDWG